MTRAKETAGLICEHLPTDLPCGEPDDILREGAPIRPEPDAGRWSPEVHYHVDGARIEAGFRSVSQSVVSGGLGPQQKL